jgi:hypothetical protein
MESMSFSVSADSAFGPQFKLSLLGEVVEGIELVQAIEKLGTQSGATKKKVTIAQSGVVY